MIRESSVVAVAAPILAINQPYSDVHDLVEGELIARTSHRHALFRDDNAKVYHYLEEATRTTQYASSIKPFQRKKDGRGAWTALVTQYAGKDKWQAEILRQEKMIHHGVWRKYEFLIGEIRCSAPSCICVSAKVC